AWQICNPGCRPHGAKEEVNGMPAWPEKPRFKHENRGLNDHLQERQDLPGFVILIGYRYDYSRLRIDPERTLPASRTLRTCATSSGVDDEASGTLPAGIPRNPGETFVSGGLQVAGSGCGGVAATLPAAGRGCDYHFFGYSDPSRGDGLAAGIGRCRAEPAGAGAHRRARQEAAHL